MESISDYLNKMTNSSEVRNKFQDLISQALQDKEVLQFIQANQEFLTTEAVERSAA